MSPIPSVIRTASTAPRKAILRRAVLCAAVLLAVLGQPASSAASEYSINACLADPGNFSTQAFSDFATRGMMWKRACDPLGPGLRGLVTSNVPRAGRVARGSRSGFVMTAPPGTRFSRLDLVGPGAPARLPLRTPAVGEPPRRPANTDQERPSEQALPTHRLRAGRSVASPTHLQHRRSDEDRPADRLRRQGEAASLFEPRPELHPDVQGAGDGGGCEPTGGFDRDRTTRSRWGSGCGVGRAVSYGALDNVGVKQAVALVGGFARGRHDRDCNYATACRAPTVRAP